MRDIRRLGLAAALALTVPAVMVAPLGRPAPASAAPADPSAWGCDSSHLPMDGDSVGLAPAPLGKNPDTNPDGSPVKISPDSRGKYVPVVMVHGWTSQDTHTDARTGTFSHLIDLSTLPPGTVSTTRSLIGQLQRIPGAAVFTFDYHPYSARWVDDSHLGPALGKVIDCLYRASGEKVIIVAHSMGGLVARYAATQAGPTGPDRSGEISTVVTFGTPETGSIIAAAIDDALLGSQTGTIIRAILSYCGQKASVKLDTGSLCDRLIAPARAFESDAGRALQAGSRQLAALKPFPRSITVDATAGDASFQIPDGGWFGWSWGTVPVPVGDLIVTSGSATSGATTSRLAHCSYQLSAVRGATDEFRLLAGFASASDVAHAPLDAFSGACFHIDLMRDITLTNEATGAIADDIAARAVYPVTNADLLSAPVPALRGNNAGRLVNGNLPDAHGSVSLALTGGGAPAHGDLTGDGISDAAAVLDATSGSGGNDEYVELYTNRDHRLGQFDPAEAAHAYHAYIMAMIIRGGEVLLDWGAEQDGGSATPFARSFWSAHLRWDGHAIVATQIAQHTGATGSGLWSDPQLTVSPAGLGAVKIGMSQQQAQQAAGMNFDGAGDGYAYPTTLPAGYPHDYVGLDPVTCVGAEAPAAGPQRVSTPEGVSLGDPASKIVAVYGKAATFMPQPTTGGISPRAGYVVNTSAGALAFALDQSHTTIIGIAAGAPGLTPSDCTG